MELRNLKTFLRVAALKNFTAAGVELGYSQANISAQIKQLEREVGAPLFDRIGRTVSLTQYGEALLPYAAFFGWWGIAKYFIEKLDDPEVLKDDLCISVIDVNGLKATNDTLGHAAGDEMICSVPICARKAFGDDVIISRTGGDEFAILTFGSPEEIASKVKMMKEYALKYKGKFIGAVYLSVGIACRSEYKDLPTEGLFQTADKFMYVDKSAFYRQKDHDRRRR